MPRVVNPRINKVTKNMGATFIYLRSTTVEFLELIDYYYLGSLVTGRCIVAEVGGERWWKSTNNGGNQ